MPEMPDRTHSTALPSNHPTPAPCCRVNELRTPEAKPFVPAEAVLAAAAAAAAGGSQTDVLAAAAASPRQPSEDTSLPSPSQVQAQSQSQRSTDSAQASQEHPLIELMTRLVARGKVTPERSAAILQQVLSPDALHDLRNASGSLSSPTTAHSDSPERVCNRWVWAGTLVLCRRAVCRGWLQQEAALAALAAPPLW
jgi:hypothetical protein